MGLPLLVVLQLVTLNCCAPICLFLLPHTHTLTPPGHSLFEHTFASQLTRIFLPPNHPDLLSVRQWARCHYLPDPILLRLAAAAALLLVGCSVKARTSPRRGSLRSEFAVWWVGLGSYHRLVSARACTLACCSPFRTRSKLSSPPTSAGASTFLPTTTWWRGQQLPVLRGICLSRRWECRRRQALHGDVRRPPAQGTSRVHIVGWVQPLARCPYFVSHGCRR